MAFRFIKASCVAVGAFNIYIVQPQWLTSKGLIPPGDVGLEAKLDEPGFRFRSSQQRIQWLITPSRVALETEDQEEDCGAVMAQLLKFLPETPLAAIGNNAHYEELLEEDIPHPPFPTDFPVVDTLSGYALRQRSFHIGVTRERCIHNVQVSLTCKRAELLTNAHCQIGPGGFTLAEEHARLFKEHRGLGIELAQHHLKVTFDVSNVL
jgi:hypothetical protein